MESWACELVDEYSVN